MPCSSRASASVVFFRRTIRNRGESNKFYQASKFIEEIKKLMNCEKIEIKLENSPEALFRIKPLIADLHSRDGAVRREARHALVFLGKRAVPSLIAALQDPDDDVRWEAAKALGEIADPRSAPCLVEMLMDHNYGVRWAASEGLIAVGEAALIPLLEKLTQHPESGWLRRQAHRVLSSAVNRNPTLRNIIGPVITALEGFEADIAGIVPAYAALDGLKKLAG